MPIEQRFPARWSTSVLVITYAVLGLMVGIAVVTYQNTPPPRCWLAAGIFAVLILMTLPFSVRGFVLTADRLWIERWGWRHAIALRDIGAVHADPEALRGSIRLWASGGLFGFFGVFWNRKLGRFRAYCTAPKNCMVVQLPHGKIVVSPDNPSAFLAALAAARPGQTPPTPL